MTPPLAKVPSTSGVFSNSRRSATLPILWTYLLVLSLPFFGFSFLNLGGRGLLRADWAFAGLLVLAFAARVLADGKLRVGKTGTFVVALNVVALLSIHYLFSGNNDQFVNFLTFYAQLALMSLLFFAVSNLNVTDGQLKNIIRTWLFVAVLVGSYSIYEVIAVNLDLPLLTFHFTNPSIKAVGTPATILWNSRPGSFLPEPGYLGFVLTPPLIILTFLLIYVRDREVLFRSVWINWAIWVVLAGAVIVSQAFATYSVLLVTGLVAFGRLSHMPQRLAKLVVVIGAVLFLLVLFTNASIVEIYKPLVARLNSITLGSDGSTQERLARAKVALQIWADHPLLGVGFGNFEQAAADVAPPAWYYQGQVTIDSSGSPWLGVLAELGIVGFLAAAGVWLSMLLRLHRAARLARPADYLSVILLALFYVVLADVIYLLQGGSLTAPQRWFDLGLASLWFVHCRTQQQSARLPANIGPP